LYSYLASNDFVVEKPIADLIEKVLQSRRKAFLLRGPAGVGKTMLATLIAQYLQAKLVFFQCTYGTSEDDLLYKYVPSETTKSGIKVTLGPIPLALRLSKSKKVVLLLDEFDKTRPSADALLLDVIQNFRVSLYIDEEEMVIHGDPENMIVFLTSNDMREFSEPLIRRVCMITLKPLPPERVFELLSKKFRKETAILLTQIYADTLNASLRKPATIQELYQLGEVIENNVQANLDDLLRMFVIKYDDDWRKFATYVASRKAYETFNMNSNRSSENLEKYYEPENVEVRIEKRSEEKRENMQLLLERLKKLTVKTIDENAKPIRIDGNETVEVTLKIPDRDLDAYTAVIKTLKPEPTNDPRRFGKFEYVEDEVKAMIAKEPLTLEEAYSIVDKTELDVEAYYETTLITVDGLENLDDLFKKASKVKYYSKNKVFLEYEGDVIEKVVLERDNNITVKVKGYVKRRNAEETPLLKTLKKYQEEFRTVKNLFRILRCKNIDISIDASSFEDGSVCTDDISAYEVATILSNAHRIRNANVYVNIDGSYNIRLEKDKAKIWVYIGYVLKNRLKEHGFSGKYSIDSDEVGRIIKVLSGE